MKKPRLNLLLTLTAVFTAFTVGLFLGRNMTHGDIQLNSVSAIVEPLQLEATQPTQPLSPSPTVSSGLQTSPDETGTPTAPTETDAPTEPDAPGKTGLININTATAAELEALPGIGPTLSHRIVDYREANGPFTSIAQITNISGIGEKKFAAIIDLITV